ncbi:hypothetical protein HCN44_000273 [Aphidius gifuensis]|uniref:Dihydroorotate dehydrogenase (quinone), mitochondrial n=1 Tax=Aphidius gifuensis TaxID=684658 RepID=A0A835CQR2_APHGI|nr:dihydroorotate dehydrogenase (quinone), mitochondrial [Aphidius gifuensis]KAF7990468.1 hypothetical protein HCN44_000273 [Aphidius gifuensis]
MARKLTSADKIKSLIAVTASGLSLFAGIKQLYQCKSIKLGFSPTQKTTDSMTLNTNIFGLKFNNPLGMAAGFDKQAEAVDGLSKMGFGFVEIGSVTPEPQPGNPKPRVFRLVQDNAVINRYGFNSDGHEAVYQRLIDLKKNKEFQGIVGVNLGKNKTSDDPIKDYADGIKKFSDIADYFVINISSPNTAGLRNLQNKKNLEELLSALNNVRDSMTIKPPLLLKLAPDLTNDEKQDIADVIQKKKSKVDGLILSNTTVTRNNLIDVQKNETGGLSGAPLTDMSTHLISDMYQRTQGKIPIIGVGGIFTGKDAYDKIAAGASLVQIYTSYIYHGPPIVNKIKNELNDLIVSNGYSSVNDVVGKAINK